MYFCEFAFESKTFPFSSAHRLKAWGGGTTGVIIGHHDGDISTFPVSSLYDFFAHDTSRVYSCLPSRRVNKIFSHLTQCVNCKTYLLKKDDNKISKIREKFPNENKQNRKCFRRGL